MQVHFGSVMLTILPQRPHHAWQSRQQCTVDSGQTAQSLGFASVLQRQSLPSQFLDDGAQAGGRENAGRFTEASQGKTSDTEAILNLGQGAGLLQATHAGNDRIEEVQQQQRDIFIAEKFAVPGLVPSGADAPETDKQFLNRAKYLKPRRSSSRI